MSDAPTIYPEQRLPWLLFGEGSQGQLLRKRDGLKDEEGVVMSEIRFRPTKEMMNRYNINYDELDDESSITKRYPSTKILSLSDDPMTNTILVFCDYNGGETRLSNMNAYLSDTIIGYEKRIKSLTAQNAWLNSEIKRMTSNINEYIKEKTKMFMTAIKVRGDIDAQFPTQPTDEESEAI